MQSATRSFTAVRPGSGTLNVATENALSNPYAFDLAEQSLQRVAANQACLNQHTLVCDGELRSPSLDYGDEPGHEHSND